MYDVTKIIERCMENTQKFGTTWSKITASCVKFDPRPLDPKEMVDAVMHCDNKVAMDYLRSVSDIRFIPGANLCPSTELSRILGKRSGRPLITKTYAACMYKYAECRHWELAQLTEEFGVSPVFLGYGKYGFETSDGDNSSYVQYSPGKEKLWTPRACLLAVLYDGGKANQMYPSKGFSNRAWKEFVVAAARLDKEGALEVKESSADVPHDNPPEPAVSHDNAKVVINMTPELLNVMIKTAVSESVNAVWQKFMGNREVFLRT